MSGNVFYFVLLVISAVVFTVFICPFLDMHGLTWLCVLFYVLIVVAFLYGRVNRLSPRPRPPRN